ncbi:hypothetical protein [Streptomyces sp. NPDC046939]|uniref:hypothetical protein n=1 Tax=Streptomyces sp. NPDC046939 TaxID=3155376 RepID=UPI0033CBCF9A
MEIADKHTGSYLVEADYIPETGTRVWRWGPEPEDAATLLADAGLPDSLMHAVAAALARWDDSRDEAPRQCRRAGSPAGTRGGPGLAGRPVTTRHPPRRPDRTGVPTLPPG